MGGMETEAAPVVACRLPWVVDKTRQPLYDMWSMVYIMVSDEESYGMNAEHCCICIPGHAYVERLLTCVRPGGGGASLGP